MDEIKALKVMLLMTKALSYATGQFSNIPAQIRMQKYSKEIEQSIQEMADGITKKDT